MKTSTIISSSTLKLRQENSQGQSWQPTWKIRNDFWTYSTNYSCKQPPFHLGDKKSNYVSNFIVIDKPGLNVETSANLDN